MDLEDVVDRPAEVLVGLDVDLPGAAEQVEVVDVQTAQRALQRGEHVVDLHAQRLRLVAVEVEVELRRVGGEGAEHVEQLGLLVGLDDQPAHHLGELGDVAAAQVLQLVLEAAGAAEADDRRQVEGERGGAGERRELGLDARG